MATKKKLLQAAAGQAGGEALNVEDVFSTYLYDGNSSTQTITNGIDLDGEGGLVWLKNRDAAYDHKLYDTERGATYSLASNTSNSAITTTNGLTSFNSDGFAVGNGPWVNNSNQSICSWTFRKAPKFFDVVTYTGTGSAQTISHNLGTTPGFIVVKGYDTAGRSWACYHRSLGYTKRLLLNYTSAEATDTTYWNAEPTDSVFSVGTQQETNLSGTTYVAYLFAHNDGDGDFGTTKDQDIIKCGSFTSSTGAGTAVDLGFEPQWVLTKWSGGVENWKIHDNMRGISSGSTDALLKPDTSQAEDTGADHLTLNPNGFNGIGSAGREYIYIAIRRGPMAVPTDATDVFAIDTKGSTGDGDEPQFRSSFPVDMSIDKSLAAGNPSTSARLIQSKQLFTDNTSSESTNSYYSYDYMNGFGALSSTNSNHIAWMWKRAPNYFDVVAYTGNGPSVNTVTHNLGVKPEMIWIKGRDTTYNWLVYHNITASGFKRQFLNLSNSDNNVRSYNSNYGLYSEPTNNQIQIDDIDADLYNGSGQKYIAYLFASLDGVSKVGSYTGTGAAGNQIDCGFSSGARFVLIKRSNSTGDWFVFDTERGIVTGNDSRLLLNSTNAEGTNLDLIDPYASGFELGTSSNAVNGSGDTYIFYAIA